MTRVVANTIYRLCITLYTPLERKSQPSMKSKFCSFMEMCKILEDLVIEHVEPPMCFIQLGLIRQYSSSKNTCKYFGLGWINSFRLKIKTFLYR